MATLLNMITEVVREADAEGHIDFTVVADKARVVARTNASLAMLHDILSGMFQDYQLTGATASQITTAATPQFALPAGVLKVRDVEYLGATGTDEGESLPLIAWSERNSYVGERAHAVAGANVLIRPTIKSVGFYKVWFTPVFTYLVADGDTYDAINGWEKLAILDAAMSLKGSDLGQDIGELERRFLRMQEHVLEAGSKRIAGRPSRVRSVKWTNAKRLARLLERNE